MVAYSFRPQFVAPIVAGTKRQTIRAERKRHARVGETVQLYTGMRTQHCRAIGLAICEGVMPIHIDVGRARIEIAGRLLQPLHGLDDFARDDGFEDWQQMRRFWEEHHPRAPMFVGMLIHWCDFTPARSATPAPSRLTAT